jgi:predicted transcriptional regulator of viral defense system
MPPRDHRGQLRAWADSRAALHARDLTAQGIPRSYLTRLCRDGELVKLGRGLYQSPSWSPTEHHALALAATAVPQGVIGLLSALRFHELGTQLPAEVWMLLPRGAAVPRLDYPPTRFLHAEAKALAAGLDRIQIEGCPVTITNPAKTVTDCFKYRGTVGLEAALEALRAALAARAATIDAIWEYALACRVAQVMRPYLEAVA